MRRILLTVIFCMMLMTLPNRPMQAQGGTIPSQWVDLPNQVYLPVALLRSDLEADPFAEGDATEAQQIAQINEAVMPIVGPSPQDRQLPGELQRLRLNTLQESKNANPITLAHLYTPGQDTQAPASQDPIEVILQLMSPSLGESVGSTTEVNGTAMNGSAMNETARRATNSQAVLAAVEAEQQVMTARLFSLDSKAEILAETQMVLNAIVVSIQPDALASLQDDPSIRSIHPVENFEMMLDKTTPYIGGTAAHNLGYTGAGVDVAVLDTGIDYTHAALGGPGSKDAYQAAYGVDANDTRNTTLDGLFPTNRVVGGYDFIGEQWPKGKLAPDPDPIDYHGHGTHVADIIGGKLGVAPEARLHALKICSAVVSSCSGIALLRALEYSVDPNQDKDPSDALDIVNLSLGNLYGLAYDSDIAQAVENLSRFGVLVVAAAGNAGDKPFVVGIPAASPSALAVAQTYVPTAILPLLKIIKPNEIAGTAKAVYQPWSARFESAVEGVVQYGMDANTLGCDPFPADSLKGKILLVDRGVCAASLKVSNGMASGAIAVLIAMTSEGEPLVFGYGNGYPGVPAFSVSQQDAQVIKANLKNTVVVRLDPIDALPLVGHVVSSSSRGPTMGTYLIKPEIAAPGASVSAIAGSGNGVGMFGGTSGAAPMVSGAMALLRQAYPQHSMAALKARLINTGETQIMNAPALLGGSLAPVTRIGGGEVRVDRAVMASATAWDEVSGQATLSFGFQELSQAEAVFTRTLRVQSDSAEEMQYQISYYFRDPADAALGALSFTLPQTLSVQSGGYSTFTLNLNLHATALPNEWALNSGAEGANGDALSKAELDGYIVLTPIGGGNRPAIHLPWHILPRRASDITIKSQANYVAVRNRGVGTAKIESYSLIGRSSNIPEGRPGTNNPRPDLRYVGYTTYAAPAGYCGSASSFIMAFAVTTWERQTHANAPASFEFDIDVDRDNRTDYMVYSWDASASTTRDFSEGRNLTWVYNLKTGAVSAQFYTDHQVNSTNSVLYFCADQIGLNLSNGLNPINIMVIANNAYYSPVTPGTPTDILMNITVTPMGERYRGGLEVAEVTAQALQNQNTAQLTSKQTGKFRLRNSGLANNNTESGILLLYRNGAGEGKEAAVIEVKR